MGKSDQNTYTLPHLYMLKSALTLTHSHLETVFLKMEEKRRESGEKESSKRRKGREGEFHFNPH